MYNPFLVNKLSSLGLTIKKVYIKIKNLVHLSSSSTTTCESIYLYIYIGGKDNNK